MFVSKHAGLQVAGIEFREAPLTEEEHAAACKILGVPEGSTIGAADDDTLDNENLGLGVDYFKLAAKPAKKPSK